VVQMLAAQKAAEQATASTALLKVFSSVQYLARQGLALQRHAECQGNLMQLLQLRYEDVIIIQPWWSGTTNFLSPESQNEILEMFSHSIQH